MDLILFGTNFPHLRNEFCRKMTRNCYTVCCFSTPFVYLKDGNFQRGEIGDILINSPGHIIYHGPIPDAKEGFVNDWMVIDGDDFTALLDRYPLPLNQAFSVRDANLFSKFTDMIQKEFRTQKIGSHEALNCIITQMFIELHRSYAKTTDVVIPYGSIASLHSRIVENPAKKWTLSEMASQCRYSVSRLCELYNAHYGKPPMTDLIERRIELAKHFLSSGQASISYVSDICGFSSVNYFSRHFKKHVGCTPTQYANSTQLPEKQP